MAIISKEGLLKVLVSYNPWWKTGVVNPKLSKTYKRFAFYEAMKRLNQMDIRRTAAGHQDGSHRLGQSGFSQGEPGERRRAMVGHPGSDTVFL